MPGSEGCLSAIGCVLCESVRCLSAELGGVAVRKFLSTAGRMGDLGTLPGKQKWLLAGWGRPPSGGQKCRLPCAPVPRLPQAPCTLGTGLRQKLEVVKVP